MAILTTGSRHSGTSVGPVCRLDHNTAINFFAKVKPKALKVDEAMNCIERSPAAQYSALCCVLKTQLHVVLAMPSPPIASAHYHCPRARIPCESAPAGAAVFSAKTGGPMPLRRLVPVAAWRVP